jgi:hypothetical protein
VLLYALSIEGSLVCDRDQLARYNPVLSLLSESTVGIILRQLFSPDFVNFYSEKREGHERLNFFTAALFFGEL